MKDIDLSTGVKEELYSQLFSQSGYDDAALLGEFSPKDITLHQHINHSGMFIADSHFWMRLGKEPVQTQRELTVFTNAHFLIVQFKAVMSALNALRGKHRHHIAKLFERDYYAHERHDNRGSDIGRDIRYRMFLQLCDDLRAGTLPPSEADVYRKAFSEYLHTDDQEFLWGDNDWSESQREESDETKRLKELRQQNGRALLSAWKNLSGPDVSDSLQKHEAEETSARVVLFGYGLGAAGVQIETHLEDDSETDRLTLFDVQHARTKGSKKGSAFAENVIHSIPPEDRIDVIDAMMDSFNEDRRFYVEYAGLDISRTSIRRIAQYIARTISTRQILAGKVLERRLRS